MNLQRDQLLEELRAAITDNLRLTVAAQRDLQQPDANRPHLEERIDKLKAVLGHQKRWRDIVQSIPDDDHSSREDTLTIIDEQGLQLLALIRRSHRRLRELHALPAAGVDTPTDMVVALEQDIAARREEFTTLAYIRSKVEAIPPGSPLRMVVIIAELVADMKRDYLPHLVE